MAATKSQPVAKEAGEVRLNMSFSSMFLCIFFPGVHGFGGLRGFWAWDLGSLGLLIQGLRRSGFAQGSRLGAWILRSKFKDAGSKFQGLLTDKNSETFSLIIVGFGG